MRLILNRRDAEFAEFQEAFSASSAIGAEKDSSLS